MIETRDLTKMYGDLYALNRLTLKLEQGRRLRLHRPQRRRQDDDHAHPRHAAQPELGRGDACAATRSTTAPRTSAASIGYMPDFFGVYDDMKVIEYLEFFAAAYRIKGPERRKKCDQVLELVDLGYKRDALVTSLSRGMTQRLGLARVLLHEPQVLLLDEPASGLDPRARIEMRGLLKELRNMGKTILVSQPHPAGAGRHLQQDRHHRARQAALRRRRGVGHPQGRGNARVHRRRSATAATTRPRRRIAGARRRRVGRARPEDDYAATSRSNDGVDDGSFIAELLVQNGFRLKMLKEEGIDLEDVFMGITKGITN